MNGPMEKYAVRGSKKLFSLVRTKIRLAREADTSECRPKPLPLVKMLSGLDVNTVEEATKFREELAANTDYFDDVSIARSVLQGMDMIEGIKYKYEPAEFMCNVNREGMKKIEREAKERRIPVNVLIMTTGAPPGLNLYVGENPPENAIILSGVPTSLACFLVYAFESDYFSDGLKLKNIVSVLGRRTLINNAIHCSLGAFGAKLVCEQNAEKDQI